MSLLPTSVGVELEYYGDVTRLGLFLGRAGWCNSEQHQYHCDCDECNPATGLLWRHQRDSTVQGEFITRIMRDWATVKHAFTVMGTAIDDTNQFTVKRYGSLAPSEYEGTMVRPTNRTGLHVHVGVTSRQQADVALRKYLLYERYFQRLGSGPFPDKREGMNLTALNAIREQDYRARTKYYTSDASASLRRQIESDRHVDINVNRRLQTVEYRVFNSTTEAWQMELAVRLALFCTLGWLPQPARFRMPPKAIPTLIPQITFQEFVDFFLQFDPHALDGVRAQRELYPDPDELPDEDAYDDGDGQPRPEPDEHAEVVEGCTCGDCVAIRNNRYPDGYIDVPRPLRRRVAPPAVVFIDEPTSEAMASGEVTTTSTTGEYTIEWNWDEVDDDDDDVDLTDDVVTTQLYNDEQFDALLAEEAAIVNRRAALDSFSPTGLWSAERLARHTITASGYMTSYAEQARRFIQAFDQVSGSEAIPRPTQEEPEDELAF